MADGKYAGVTSIDYESVGKTAGCPGSGVGGTKPISSVPLFSEFFNIFKTHVIYWRSRLY